MSAAIRFKALLLAEYLQFIKYKIRVLQSSAERNADSLSRGGKMIGKRIKSQFDDAPMGCDATDVVIAKVQS
ncbi:hypothetical protein AKJ29_01340 [Aliiroseovarius crassostreae]|uniref:Uncharacterized protein n=1 Tax=Aliiroseovarius crassostreae TaxID=154981 RepID=A0A0P7IVV3_9RHOB|nr:hypothetical protein AKJ29_01340 [Aliiroseovarius crassostreae]